MSYQPLISYLLYKANKKTIENVLPNISIAHQILLYTINLVIYTYTQRSLKVTLKPNYNPNLRSYRQLLYLFYIISTRTFIHVVKICRESAR